MLKLRRIAITGGLASGKTSVCQFFQELGAFVVNADAIVHELLSSDTDLAHELLRHFGSNIVKNGSIDRKALAKEVFSDPRKLQFLEEILHPMVLKKIEEQYKTASLANRYAAFVVEIPLLFEIQAEGFYDYTIAVLADEALAKKRLLQKQKESTDYEQRMQRQLSPSQKAARADFTIMNNGSLTQLKEEVSKINTIIMKQR